MKEAISHFDDLTVEQTVSVSNLIGQFLYLRYVSVISDEQILLSLTAINDDKSGTYLVTVNM